ncbi:MAG: RlmE family RNA methyltransferase [Candidatus Pacebacteria bacterium]|nr:RlmE family RNA methyltransferase [Candidatus Paceibacterota bacterium]
MYRKDLKDEAYTIRAKREGYPARSVYKLKEIDEKYKVFKKGNLVLDLGSSPGSWLIYISNKIGEKGRVVGVDLEDIKIPLSGNILFIKKDILNTKPLDLLILGKKYNVLVSDLSPKTSGLKSFDSAKSLELSEKSLELAHNLLEKGGNFICKIFEGESVSDFFKKVSDSFEFVKRFKPRASFKKSKELYIIAKGFKKIYED